MNLKMHKSPIVALPVKLELTYSGSGALEIKGEGRTNDGIQMLFVSLAMMMVDNIKPDACLKQLCADAASLLTAEIKSFYEETNDHATKKH